MVNGQILLGPVVNGLNHSGRVGVGTTLLHELGRTGGGYGVQTMGEGGGQANVTIIERL